MLSLFPDSTLHAAVCLCAQVCTCPSGGVLEDPVAEWRYTCRRVEEEAGWKR